MKKTILRTGIPLLVLISVFGAVFLYNRLSNKPVTTLRATGIIDGVEVNLSPKIAGRISWICCREGDTVKAGEEAVKLESRDLAASVEQAIAAVSGARQDVATAGAAIESAKANILSAEANAKSAAAEVERMRADRDEAARESARAKDLYRKDFISRESLDQTVARYDASAAAYDSAEAKKNAALAQKEAATAQFKSAISQQKSAEARLGEAEAALSFARSKLDDTVITSPVSGTVIFKSVEAGETLSPGVTIMTIVDLKGLYARLDIDETKIGGVVLNSPALITVDGLPGKVFRGSVSEIGRHADFATQRDVVRGREDIKTFRVKVRVENPEGLLKPGMTVEAAIPLRK